MEFMIGVPVYCALLIPGQLGGRDVKNRHYPILIERGVLFSVGLLNIFVKSIVSCFYLLVPVLYIMIFQGHFILGIVMLFVLFSLSFTLLCYSSALAIYLFTKEISYSDWWEWFIAIITFISANVYIAGILLVCYIGIYPLWFRISVSVLISIGFVLLGFFSFYYTAHKYQRQK
jgi:hypothetical protein